MSAARAMVAERRWRFSSMAWRAPPWNQWLPINFLLQPLRMPILGMRASPLLFSAWSLASCKQSTFCRNWRTSLRRHCFALAAAACRKALWLSMLSSPMQTRQRCTNRGPRRWVPWLPGRGKQSSAIASMSSSATRLRRFRMAAWLTYRSSFWPRCLRKAPIPKGKKIASSTPSLPMANRALRQSLPMSRTYRSSSSRRTGLESRPCFQQHLGLVPLWLFPTT
mmetsp:Transcript_17538/g.52988  ORF Transcript_17538/g.52988 Transcript_17538/m.52988 type:complete len:223 (-) Transcript_17538:841-1509(-)